MIIKTPDQNAKKQRKNLANPHCQAIMSLRSVNNAYIGLKTKQYCQATFRGDKKMTKINAKKHMHINEKRHHYFRQYVGPVHTYPLLFENKDFLLLFDLVCFVLFSPVWAIDDNSVSGDNSYRKCILSKCLPKWRLLNTFASRLRVDG